MRCQVNTLTEAYMQWQTVCIFLIQICFIDSTFNEMVDCAELPILRYTIIRDLNLVTSKA